jgi:GNAT superfamily N-acetyltransferase
MEPADRMDVADLICVSTNYWYQSRGGPQIFPGGPEATVVFYDVYEALDPGCGVVAVHKPTGRLMGSCFYHPRPTHVSLGIMNVHPNWFRHGVARALLGNIVDYADREEKPLRLVSSAMNLDSFSLYTRAGFTPRCAYQDMFIRVPEEGLAHQVVGSEHVREATTEDIVRMASLEMDLVGIQRDKDFRYFIENEAGFWHVSVYENRDGGIDGFLVSSAHPGCNMVGPGAAKTAGLMAALILAELDQHKGRQPVLLVPVDCGELVARMYQWGARNCETHFGQVRGRSHAIDGVFMPTFLPESA